MTSCSFIRIPKQKLCSGDLSNFITIQTRTLGETKPGESSPSEVFVTLKQVWAGIITPQLQGAGTQRFSGVTLNESTTHMFYVFYDPDIALLEVANHFVLLNSQRYRILSVVNLNEMNDTILIQAENTGIDSKTGSQA